MKLKTLGDGKNNRLYHMVYQEIENCNTENKIKKNDWDLEIETLYSENKIEVARCGHEKKLHCEKGIKQNHEVEMYERKTANISVSLKTLIKPFWT